MKHKIMIAVALLMIGSVASAQQSKSDETVEFRPHWGLELQGGASYTIGEAPFLELISPAAQVSATYNFHHAMGVRFGLSGWQGKGSVVATDEIYRFRFAQLHADYVLNLGSLIGGFKHDRIFNPYIFAGIAGAYGFDNKEAAQYVPEHGEVLALYWEKTPMFVGRAGLGADFWVSKNVALGLEANAACYGDKLNSKPVVGDEFVPDWQFNALVGVKFRFGGNTRPSQAYAAAQAAAAAAAAEAAAAAAEAERLAAEKAEAERLAAEKAAAEKAAAEAEAARLAAEKAAAERAALCAENSINVFFGFDSAVISKAEAVKVEKLAQWLIDNPDFDVDLVGYADKGTGTAAVNMRVSERRVNAVKNMLIKLGVPVERMTSTYVGDTVQPFSENRKNRVIICTVK